MLRNIHLEQFTSGELKPMARLFAVLDLEEIIDRCAIVGKEKVAQELGLKLLEHATIDIEGFLGDVIDKANDNDSGCGGMADTLA